MSPGRFIAICTIPATIFTLNLAVISFFILDSLGFTRMLFLFIPGFFGLGMLLCLLIPKINADRIAKNIEADIFVPSRMLVTLLESGNSLVSAFERVSRTRTVSGQYFGKISTEIFLGKNIDQAISDAIRNTPSRSFKRVLEPIRNSLRTGASIEKNLNDTLIDLTKEKIVEIEQYEKRLAPVSMFYMIFGTIIPTILVVALIVVFSVIGIDITFFPFLFMLLIAIILMQLFFFHVFQNIRPLVKL